MKLLSAFILSFIIPASLHSQEDRSYVALSSGISFPVGMYASKTLDGGSFALPGWNAGLEGAWFFYKKLGAGLEADYYAHPVDVGSLAIEKNARDPFVEELEIRSDPYRTLTLAAYVHYHFKVGKKISLTPKAGGGLIYGFSPYQLYKPVYFMVASKWYEITSARDLGGYASAGAAFRYPLYECLDLLLEMEYGFGALTYEFMTGTGEIRQEDHQVMLVNVLAGIAVRF
jgi:hypothetical protein